MAQVALEAAALLSTWNRPDCLFWRFRTIGLDHQTKAFLLHPPGTSITDLALPPQIEVLPQPQWPWSSDAVFGAAAGGTKQSFVGMNGRAAWMFAWNTTPCTTRAAHSHITSHCAQHGLRHPTFRTHGTLKMTRSSPARGQPCSRAIAPCRRTSLPGWTRQTQRMAGTSRGARSAHRPLAWLPGLFFACLGAWPCTSWSWRHGASAGMVKSLSPLRVSIMDAAGAQCSSCPGNE